MSNHTKQNILFVANHSSEVAHSQRALSKLTDYLDHTACLAIDTATDLPTDLSDLRAVILTDAASLAPTQQQTLDAYVNAGGAVVALTGLNTDPLPEFFGATPSNIGPPNELRVLFTNHDNPLRNRLPVMSYLQGRYHYLEPKLDSVETILYCDWRYGHSSVLTHNRVGDGHAIATTLQDFSNLWLQQVIYRLLREVTQAKPTSEPTLGVGLLGYSPAVGLLHGTGTAETTGLDLRAICDLSPLRIAEAQRDFPTATIHENADTLGADPNIDLVVIATPPSSHAKLAIDLLNAASTLSAKSRWPSIAPKPKRCSTPHSATIALSAVTKIGAGMLTIWRSKRRSRSSVLASYSTAKRLWAASITRAATGTRTTPSLAAQPTTGARTTSTGCLA